MNKRKKKPKKKGFRKTLRQSTHPIPPEQVEESNSRYDRSRAKRERDNEIEREMDEENGEKEKEPGED